MSKHLFVPTLARFQAKSDTGVTMNIKAHIIISTNDIFMDKYCSLLACLLEIPPDKFNNLFSLKRTTFRHNIRCITGRETKWLKNMYLVRYLPVSCNRACYEIWTNRFSRHISPFSLQISRTIILQFSKWSTIFI